MNQTRHNVLLLTIDSLRADYLGVYNPAIARAGLTPEIDRWAGRSAVFTHAMAQSAHTAPSFRAILSGSYPSTYGDWFHILSDQRPMLAELLKARGYRTYAFHSNPYISHVYRFDRGFDVFDDHLPSLSTPRTSRAALATWTKIKAVLSEPYENAETITRQAMAHLGSAPRPYFMWVHYMDVHGPYIAKRGWRFKNRVQAAMLWKKALQQPGRISREERERLIATYKEEIAYLDTHLGTLLNAANRKETIVILTADHGDLLGEHGLFGHSVKLYNGVLHVPLVISLPQEGDRNGRVVTTPVRSMDLVPTLVDLLGLTPPHTFEGKSLASLMTDTGDPYRCDYIISELSRKHLCVQTKEWKLIVNYKANEKELYNLKNDPEETVNHLQQDRAVAAELEAVLHDHLRRTPADAGPGAIHHNEAMKARLQALGYME